MLNSGRSNILNGHENLIFWLIYPLQLSYEMVGEEGGQIGLIWGGFEQMVFTNNEVVIYFNCPFHKGKQIADMGPTPCYHNISLAKFVWNLMLEEP
jgi:hypothetical protein